MILGRFIGILVAVILASAFPADTLLAQASLWVVFAVIGLIISIFISIILGINISTDRPYKLDSRDYWINKYGPELGNDAYEIWVDSFKR